MRADAPASSWEESQLPLAPQEQPCLTYCNSTWSPNSTSQLERNPEFPTTTQEEPRVPCLNSKCGLIPLQWLERNPEFPNFLSSCNRYLGEPLELLRESTRHEPQDPHATAEDAQEITPTQLGKNLLPETEKKPHTTPKQEAHLATKIQ